MEPYGTPSVSFTGSEQLFIIMSIKAVSSHPKYLDLARKECEFKAVESFSQAVPKLATLMSHLVKLQNLPNLLHISLRM